MPGEGDGHRTAGDSNFETRLSIEVNKVAKIFHSFACEAKDAVTGFAMQMDRLKVQPALQNIEFHP